MLNLPGISARTFFNYIDDIVKIIDMPEICTLTMRYNSYMYNILLGILYNHKLHWSAEKNYLFQNLLL